MSDPFIEYQDKVNYDYIIEIIVPTEYESREYGKPDEFQLNLLDGDLEKQLESVLYNEDYLKDGFPELGLGRVYPILVGPVLDAQIKFGLSLIDAKESVTLQDMIDDCVEVGWNVISETEGEDINGTEDREPDKIYITNKGKREDIKVNVIKSPKQEGLNIDFDKQLVTEGILTFKNPANDKCTKLTMNDNGIVELKENDVLIKSIPFSKTALINECKSLLSKNMLFVESEIKVDKDTNIDTEKEKANLEQASRELDDIQKLKDEVNDKVEKLFNEEKQLDSFESTEATNKLLSKAELRSIDLSDILNETQIQWIETYIDTLSRVQGAVKALAEMLPLDDNEPAISLDKYIEELNKNFNEGGN